MKANISKREDGSVLMVTMFSILIMTFICATSLYIAGQNNSTGLQAAGWQQALTGAESGVDAAVRALNTNVWTFPDASGSPVSWKTVPLNGSPVPSVEPSPGTGAVSTSVPSATAYNYLPSQISLPMTGQGATSVSSWVTIDTAGAGSLQDGSGHQWYRVRSTGYATMSGPRRVSANKLDNDLRNTIALVFDRRYTGSTPTAGNGASRTIEVIMQPAIQSGWPGPITLGSWISQSGSGFIDSFNSSTATGHIWSLGARITPQTATLVNTMNNSGQGDLRNTYVYGGINYSGPAVQNTTNVQGQIATPDNAVIYPTFDPTQVNPNSISWQYTDPSGAVSNYAWASSGGGGGNGTYPPSGGTYAVISGGGGLPKNLSTNATITSLTANGTAAAPTLVVVNSDFTVSGGNTFAINGAANSYITIWVKGKFTTSGGGVVTQAAGTHVTWVVDKDITVSGDSYSNLNNTASSTSFVAVSGALTNGKYANQNKITVSGSSTFIGTVDGPGLDATVSGSGGFSGALISNTLTISGSASFHYDTALSTSGGSSTAGNYSFASWFENNSDGYRKITY